MSMNLATIAFALLSASTAPVAQDDPIKVLIITGDQYHDWKATTAALKEILEEGDKFEVESTETPAKDLTPENLDKYDVLLLNYGVAKPTEETTWTEANKQAILDAVHGGKGLVVYHYASSAFAKPNWEEFEKMIAGGWRSQGFHGPPHEFTVKTADTSHPITEGLPAEFDHTLDELYSNSLMIPGNVVLATAYSDPDKPKGTGKDEPVIWVNTYGEGRVYNNALGHDLTSLDDPVLHQWLRRGVEWAATGDVAD